MAKKIYCIDTSALIAAWYERYKPKRKLSVYRLLKAHDLITAR
ncbi:DUF4411 family protein [Bradyrhizobium sp. SRL28]|nr:DUF4411 family protein [Bradyrhizobium sp. SRL28]